MADDKVSRRDFLSKSTMAASTVVAGSASGAAGAQEGDQHEHEQSDFTLRTKALVSVLTRKNLVNPATMAPSSRKLHSWRTRRARTSRRFSKARRG